MKKFKQLREQFLSEALSRKFNDKDVDKEFKSMKDAGAFYGDLDKAREEMKKDYHPGNSARPNVWTALRYPVRNGDYYFAFIDKSEKKNMKYNQMLNDALKTAKVGGDKKSVDDLWLVASNELRTYPTSLGWNDTMTREEIYGAIQHMLGKIREEVQQTKEFFGMFNKKDPHKHLRVGKRKNAPRYESVKESVNERVHYAFDTQKAARAFQKKVDGMPMNIVKAGTGKYYIVDLRPGTKQADQEKAAKIAVSIGLSESYIEEASFSSSLIKRAVKIAKDMGGNMTGAYKKIERMKKGLGDHPEVEDALRLANESIDEGLMKKMSQIQIKRKYGRVIKKALSKGSLELPSDAEEALYMYAFDNGEIKTDDPDEFTDWLDDNLKDFS